MRCALAGFNVFGQWPEHEPIIRTFEAYNMNMSNSDSKDFQILLVEWSYNVFRVNDKLYLSGVWAEHESQLMKIELPNGNFKNIIELEVSGNDRYLLILDRIDKIIWRYTFNDSSTQEWVPISHFWNVEMSMEKTEDGLKQSFIVKVKVGTVMTLCLSSEGQVYQLPGRVDTSRCIGKVVDIDCGHEHAILLTDKGNVYTWGNARRCQLGHGDLKNLEEPELVEALAGINITKVRAGGWHSCALSDSGDLYTWGWNDEGQLGTLEDTECKLDKYSMGDGSPESKKFRTEDSVKSTAIPTLVDIFESETSVHPMQCDIIDVACGSKHTAIVLSNNSVWTTGINSYCQLGIDFEDLKRSNCFRKVYELINKCSVICGPWSTIVIYE